MSRTNHRIPATFKQRIVAFLFDYLLICAYLVVLALISTASMQLSDSDTCSRLFLNPLTADLIAFATTVLPVSLYFAVSESSPAMATWGKKRVGIVVRSAEGQQLTFLRALARSFAKFLPWQIAHTCLFNIPGWPIEPGTPDNWVYVGFGVMWLLVLAYLGSIALGKDNQAIYDKLFGITVESAG